MGATKRTVVIELSDEFYSALAEEAQKAERPLDELLIGHACCITLNLLGRNGEVRKWRHLMRLWREFDPKHAPGLDIEELFLES